MLVISSMTVFSVTALAGMGWRFDGVSTGPEFIGSVSHRTVISGQVDTDTGKTPVDLCYSYEDTNKPPELQLIAHEGGKDLVIWWAYVVSPRCLPLDCAWNEDTNKHLLGLLYTFTDCKCIFYEIDLDKVLKSAKSNAGRTLGSEWLEGSPLTGSTNPFVTMQYFYLNELMNDREIAYMYNLDLNVETDKWVMSGILRWEPSARHGLISWTPLAPMRDLKVFLQSPVDGTGVALLRKERIAEQVGDIPFYVGKWWFALCGGCLLIMTVVLIAYRGRSKRQLATKTKI